MPTLADLWAAIQEAHLVDDPRYASLVNAVSEPCGHKYVFWGNTTRAKATFHCPECKATWVDGEIPATRLPRVYPDVPGAVSGVIGAAAEQIATRLSDLLDDAMYQWTEVEAVADCWDDPDTIAAALAAIQEVAHDAGIQRPEEASHDRPE